MKLNFVQGILDEVNFFESLILAQDERWRRALSMQVERDLCVAPIDGRHFSLGNTNQTVARVIFDLCVQCTSSVADE